MPQNTRGMKLPIDPPPLDEILEASSQGLRRLAGAGTYREAEAYFDPDEPRPGDPAYLERLEPINENFVEWLDPGPIVAPPPNEIKLVNGLWRFKSAVELGDPRVDRVAVRVYPTPDEAPAVGVLFHPWLGLDGWLAPDWLLRPLTRRFRVAVMVAGHHDPRCAKGFDSGEGMINLNPRHFFEGLRQWQADQLATLDFLRRDHGFEKTVLLGYSLGGFAAVLGRLFSEPLPTVAVAAPNSFARGVFEGEYTEDLARRLLEAGFTEKSFRQATRALHLARWGNKISGRKLSWMRPRFDHIEPEDSFEEIRRRIAPDRTLDIGGGHSTGLLHREEIAAEVTRRVEAELQDRSSI